MSEKEPSAKKQRMEGSREYNQQLGMGVANDFQGGVKRMAVTFVEFLRDPLLYSPRPEFIDNFYIEVLDKILFCFDSFSFRMTPH
jgi:hypothetical protein